LFSSLLGLGGLLVCTNKQFLSGVASEFVVQEQILHRRPPDQRLGLAEASGRGLEGVPAIEERTVAPKGEGKGGQDN
jgi:hypothetical protein